MSGAPSKLLYENRKNQVNWQGFDLPDCDDLDSFMCNEVSARLNDEEGNNEFEAHLRSLPLTGFGESNLEAVLNSATQEERDWAVSEALAEAWLAAEHGIIWPWNMERDKRNANASLPGADLIGFVANGAESRLVLGEVKSSTEEKYPPQVMSGRSGHIGHQIDNLANNLGTIVQLIKWLCPRCKGTEFEGLYNAALTLYFNSGNKAVTLYGVLIRDTDATERDLKGRGNALGDNLEAPTTCHLLAFYLPYEIADLPKRVTGGAAI